MTRSTYLQPKWIIMEKYGTLTMLPKWTIGKYKKNLKDSLTSMDKEVTRSTYAYQKIGLLWHNRGH